MFVTVLLLAIRSGAQTPLFVAQPPVSVGTSPLGVATADFNGDGKADVAVANELSNTISVLLGDGHGGYSPAPAISGSMNNPYALAVGDFNNDGKADLAVTNFGNSTVTVWLGNGDGTFTLGGAPTGVGSDPTSVVVGDFNGDGKPDLAVANNGSKTISILLGNGSGGFTPGSPISVPNQPFALAVADFNRDAKLDIASTEGTSNTLDVYLGNGDGTFQKAISSIGLSHPESGLAVADFNKDGIPDVAVSNSTNGTVSILLGDGTGKFSIASGSPISVGVNLNGLVAGDFSGDGNPDFAVVDSASNSVKVFLGHGDGTFAAEVGSPYGVGRNPYWLAAGNFSGQGKQDLVVTNQSDNSIQFLFNSGNNRQTSTTFTSSLNPATFGTPVTFTATVTGVGGNPTGTVTSTMAARA